MLLTRKIDLHVHTTVSDGTDTPAEIVRRVKEEGIKIFSVTDHDAVEGCAIINNLLEEGDPAFIYGVEFSCEDQEGKYQILGYGFDPDSPYMSELISRARAFCTSNLQNTLEFLKREYGFDFSSADRDLLFTLNNPGKKHLAGLMVRYGYASTKNDALINYIKKCKTKDTFIRPEEAIRAILKSNGIPVLSHPFFGNGEEFIQLREVERRIKRLTKMGLKGVEVFYSGFTETMKKDLMDLADKYRLYVTAGSDYHGSNKLDRLGDTDLGSYPEYPKRLQKFLKKTRIYNNNMEKKRFSLFRKRAPLPERRLS